MGCLVVKAKQEAASCACMAHQHAQLITPVQDLRYIASFPGLNDEFWIVIVFLNYHSELF